MQGAEPRPSAPRGAAADRKTLAELVYGLADPDPAVRGRAGARLRATYLDSQDAVARALDRLHALDYTRISREARIALMDFLTETSDPAWTPDLRREAAAVARRHRAAIETGGWQPGAESRRSFEAFDARFGALNRLP